MVRCRGKDAPFLWEIIVKTVKVYVNHPMEVSVSDELFERIHKYLTPMFHDPILGREIVQALEKLLPQGHEVHSYHIPEEIT